LAAGLALSRVGWEVTVLEQAPELKEVGAGLQISPNGVKVLEALNLMEALQPLVFEPEFIRLSMGRTGRKIFELPMKGYAEDRWGAKYLHVHRADLHQPARRSRAMCANAAARVCICKTARGSMAIW